MRKSFALMVLAAISLVACGGGGDDDSFRPPGNGGSTPGGATVSTVAVSSSKASVPLDGSGSAEITAVVKDAGNVALSGVTVSFAASSGGSLVVSQGTTDDSGQAKATLQSDGAAAGSSITVTATAGGVSGSTSVNVVSLQQTVSVATDSPQISTDGSNSAKITALVRGPNNQFLAGIPVNFEASSGGLSVTQGTTDENGAAVAVLTAAADPTNRQAVVTASVGPSSSSVSVDIVGTTLTLEGSSNIVQGSQAQYTATLLDAGKKAIAGKSVSFVSSNGNTLSATSGTTNPNGKFAILVTASNAGVDTLTATSLGLSAQQSISVSSQNFTFTAPAAGTEVALGASQQVAVTWTASGAPQAGQTISFATTRGTLSAPTAVTDASGVATINISSLVSGDARLTASSNGVVAQLDIKFIATTPTTLAINATPSAISTGGQSTITATVRDAQNNFVEGKMVVFETVSDITGGTLSVATATTNSEGVAQTTYVASNTPSSSNGVVVRATVQNTSITADTTLTVGGQTVSLSLGTGNKLGENASKTQFIMPYTVTALDSQGKALNNAQITLTIHSVLYGKGGWIAPAGATGWAQTSTPGSGTINPITVCPNEDANLNALREPTLGEDVAGQGNNNQVLDPGEIAAVSTGVVTTANGGSADFQVIYPQDHAGWVQVRLTASTGVTGTESSTSAVFWLPMLADYVNDTQVSPPGVVSPYGIATTCTDPN